jgi:hypothetical protein
MNDPIEYQEDVYDNLFEEEEQSEIEKRRKILANHVEALSNLLKDPHYENGEWCLEYSEHMEYISTYWQTY